MSTPEETKNIVREYVKEVYDGDTDFIDEAKNIIQWLSKNYYIVEKDRVRNEFAEAARIAEIIHKNRYPQEYDFGQSHGIMSVLRRLFGKKLLNMTRQEANREIAYIMKNHSEPLVRDIATDFEMCTERYPQQRAGQIICNYICGDYRDPEPMNPTKVILEALFPGNPDPFFEESTETLKRLKNKKDEI